MTENPSAIELRGAYKDVIKFWNRFGTLPAEDTKSMHALLNKIHYFSKYYGARNRLCNRKFSKVEEERLYTFSKTLEEFGCENKYLCGIHHCPEFDTEPVQKRVREMVINNGSCAIKYIAEMSIPGVSLPEEFVYYYYYSCAYDKDEYWTIRPLGFLYVIDKDFGRYFLRVHYRDYHRCDIERIRESARNHYRDWSKEPPQTLEDWKYYGQCGLFISEGYFGKSQGTLLSEDWSTDIVELSFKRSERYFYMYDRYKYMDYLLFLLEKGYTIYQSDITRWLVNWLDLEGKTSMDESIRQKVKEKLKLKGINLNNLPTYGSI
jgi:hypothetical protein